MVNLLQIYRFLCGLREEEHTQMLKRRERERKIYLRMVLLGRKHSIHGNPSHLTATRVPWRSKISIPFPPSCISSYELYRMIFPTKSNFIAPPAAAAVVPTEGSKIMMAGLSNVLLDRSHPRCVWLRTCRCHEITSGSCSRACSLHGPGLPWLAVRGRQSSWAATCGGERAGSLSGGGRES